MPAALSQKDLDKLPPKVREQILAQIAPAAAPVSEAAPKERAKPVRRYRAERLRREAARAKKLETWQAFFGMLRGFAFLGVAIACFCFWWRNWLF